MAFEKARSLFQIKAYDGAVNLLLSTDNLSRKKWGDSPKLKSCFSADVRISEIGATAKYSTSATGRLRDI
jgi:hypothetical protein